MRKTKRPTTPRTPARPRLPLRKETVRTLDSDQLSGIQTGITCPTTMSTIRTTKQENPGDEN
jgi:hypothetical protein